MSGEDIVLLTFALLPALLAVALYLFRRFGLHRRSPRLLCLALGNALVLLFLVSLVLLCGEIYYRFIFDESEALGLTKVSNRWFDRHWRMNTSGFRDTIEYLRRPPPRHRRVTFLGDSITTGHGLADVDDRFANLIRHGHEMWDVHVLAKNGWNTQEQIEIVDELSKEGYVFDQVVLVYSLNDLGPLVPGCRDVLKELYVTPDPGFLLRESYFLDLLYQRMVVAADQAAPRFFDHLRAGYEGEPWREQEQRLGRFVRLVRSSGGRLSVVTFPCLQKGTGEGEFRPAHERLASFWGRLDVPHLDLSEVFRGRALEDLVVNARDAHPNEAANALASGAIASFLAAQMGR